MTRPRKPAHFKVSVNILNHPKTAGFANDPLLLGVYVNIGIMAVDRWASKAGDSFLCSGLDLQRLAGCQGVANAGRRLGQLEARGGPTLSREGAMWRLTLPNLTKRQGFPNSKGTEKPSPTTTTTTTTPTEYKGGPSAGAEPTSPETKGAKKRAHRCPEHPTPDETRRLDSWGAKRPEKYTPEVMAHAWNEVYEWSRDLTDTKKACKNSWTKAVMNSMLPENDVWGLKGFVDPCASKPNMTESERVKMDMARRKRKIEESK